MNQNAFRVGSVAGFVLAGFLALRLIGEGIAGFDVYTQSARRFLPQIDEGAAGVLIAAFAMMVTPLFAVPFLAGLWHAFAPADRLWGTIAAAFQGVGFTVSVVAFAAYGILVQVADRYADSAGAQQDAYANDGEVVAGLVVILQQVAFGAIGAGLAATGWIWTKPGAIPRWFGYVTLVFGVLAFLYIFTYPVVIALHPFWTAGAAWLLLQAARRPQPDAAGAATLGSTNPPPRSPWQSR